MAVFTSLSEAELRPWLSQYDAGELRSLTGIASGIENSNFFLGTSAGEFVLTIFEKLSAAELPFYLGLTAHLEHQGIPCPGPVLDRAGRHFSELKGKPAAIVRRLPGKSHMQPSDADRAQVAATLARMHIAGQSYSNVQENPRGPHWWAVTAPRVLPFLSAENQAMLSDELRFQASHRLDQLPRGPIHADLFRDNVLFDDNTLGGFIDFYFAGWDCLLFDVAVCVNDWCIAREGADSGRLLDEQARVFLAAYHAVRPFDAAEHAAWPVMLRAGALRFWLSRLFDFHLPRPGELITPHDPGHFERILRLRRAAAAPLRV
ncbi:MAG TPA: homoserine kinase [Burkholderiales bacterium]|jgi:homoserine kinase type II|nr:homoserine kinase [Burkholderiales bacterium]